MFNLNKGKSLYLISKTVVKIRKYEASLPITLSYYTFHIILQWQNFLYFWFIILLGQDDL